MTDWSSTESIRQACSAFRKSVLENINDKSISAAQEASLVERVVKGAVWASRFRSEAPKEDDARRLLCRAIDSHTESDNGTYQAPAAGPIEGHWIGARLGSVGKDEPEPDMSEAAKFEAMTDEARSGLVVFFVHGGAFYANGPSAYRKTHARLARMTGGRTYCIQQRLAPQHPFPNALLDVLHGYLSLLAPPPGAYHQAIPASSIVLAGDSSGACLALGLLQILLTIKREGWTGSIPFHGQDVQLVLPAGLTAISPVADLANAFPSWDSNAETDWFPKEAHFLEPSFPACEIWPSDPPRASIYCDADMLCHAIPSPVLARDWTGSPPIWLASGQEMIVDGVKLLAQNMHRQGVRVTFFEYELMPHMWFTIFADSPQARKVWNNWSGAIKGMYRREVPASSATFVCAEGLKEEPIQMDELISMTRHEARSRMVQKVRSLTPFKRRAESHDDSKL